MHRIKTACEGLDSLTDGGLPTGTITQVFGEKALGKSIISLQAAHSAVAAGHSALILDTEQSYISYLLPYWQERLQRRFGKDITTGTIKLERIPRGSKKNPVTRSQLVTAMSSVLEQLGVTYMEMQLKAAVDALSPDFQLEYEVQSPAVYVAEMPEVIGLLALHGVDAGIEVSSGGRVELRLRQTPTPQSAIRRLVQETGAKLLIYDSISAPLKASFPSTQDLPARSAAMAMMLTHAQKLCVEHGIAVLTTSHVSINPTQGWDRRPYGGAILGHEAKFSFELTQPYAKRNQTAVPVNPDSKEVATRVIWVHRHPALADLSRFAYIKIDDEGFH